MLDFVKIQEIEGKKSTTIQPEFVVGASKDLMIRGHAFYAIWDEEAGFWSKSEQDVQRLIDQMIFDHAKNVEGKVKLKLLKDFSSSKWSEWQRYCKSMPDNYEELDSNVIFANTDVKKEDYATRKLSHSLIKQETPAYDELMNELYEAKEREKFEWGLGSVINGASKDIQKFFVFYGGPGTGKSTVLNILSDILDGYVSIFDAKALSSSSNVFALDAFASNPLVSIQHDGDLSRIEDNTKLNSVVSHESMIVNEKFKAPYISQFKTMLFMGTNKPVKITDAKSGILRRLIDIHPTGRKLPYNKYQRLMKQIKYELGGIAYHCKEVFERLGSGYYNDYVPSLMLGVTNEFYIFIEDNYDLFAKAEDDMITLTTAWMRYKDYCEQANIRYPMSMRAFKEEMLSYYKDFYPRHKGLYSVYVGFRKDKFMTKLNYEGVPKEEGYESWLMLKEQPSEFDIRFCDCLAQYANDAEKPKDKWVKVLYSLSNLNTHELHYVKIPERLVVIDFDLKDSEGKKDLKKNLIAASEWPQTYAEVSKGGGLHLHYFYDGDLDELSKVYDDGIEIKVYRGNASLRRKLTKCNDIPIAHISCGLPLKERRKNMLNNMTVKSEKALRELIERNLRKEIHPATKPSMDFIYKILEDAFESDLSYNLMDLRPAIQNFALRSTHQPDYCFRLIKKMKFRSKDVILGGVEFSPEGYDAYKSDAPIIFFDVEVFKNLFVICWKLPGKDTTIVNMINPTPLEVEKLTKYRLIGFNNRKYDNHILYGAIMGYNNMQLYELSQKIIDGDNNAFFSEAYNLSYTDIYDYLSSQNKMSLKKWEIKLGIHHEELGLPWDQEVPDNLVDKVVGYCGYDVTGTEAVFDATQSDWKAREILADISGGTVNDTTNSLTTKFIVGNDRNPQAQYIYTDLSEIFPGYEYNPYGIDSSRYNEGAKIVRGKSIYRGEDPGEGGYVYAEPGIYTNAAVLDIASMHPHSAIALNIFGKYTKRFEEIVQTRILIKHKEYDKVKTLFDGKLAKYLDDPEAAKSLANALKTAINSVYGLTSATFPNKLKDPKNIDNIVAKRGALFMINLKHEVQERGYKVIHIKTDSIKIANATPEIIQFVMEYGKEYGYTFEHECTYDRICLVNDAVYIAKVGYGENGVKLDEPYWTATGTQFQVPYVFKTLFSKEPIEFRDLCETKTVTTALYLDCNENLGEEHDYVFVGKVGSFCPMKDGAGGGLLLREISPDRRKDKRFAAATRSSKNGRTYRWLEAEKVKSSGLEDMIDRSYYNALVDEAVETINKYDNFEAFVSDGPYLGKDWMNIPETDDDELPFK